MSLSQSMKQEVMMTPEWERVIKLAKRLKYGEFKVKIKDGKPYMVENLVQQIRMDNDNDYKVQVL